MGRPRTAILSPARIARAALAMVAEERDFTIPGIAARLGVHPSSLYHHLPGGRRAIVDRMREELYAGIDLVPLTDPAAAPDQRLAAWMRAYRNATARAPAVIPLLMGQQVDDLRTLDVYEALFEILAEAGVDASRVVDVATMVDVAVLGSALDAASPAPLWAPQQTHPRLSAAAGQDDRDRTVRGFDLLVDAVVGAVCAGSAATTLS